jgi:hypothetical protein
MNSINGPSIPHDGSLANGTQSYRFAMCPFNPARLKARRLYECWFFLIQHDYTAALPNSLYLLSTLLNTAS